MWSWARCLLPRSALQSTPAAPRARASLQQMASTTPPQSCSTSKLACGHSSSLPNVAGLLWPRLLFVECILMGNMAHFVLHSKLACDMQVYSVCVCADTGICKARRSFCTQNLVMSSLVSSSKATSAALQPHICENTDLYTESRQARCVSLMTDAPSHFSVLRAC